MGPKFRDPILLSNGKLKVEGPFETDGQVLDKVVVRFLIIPDESKTPIFGTATIARLRIFQPDPAKPDWVTRGTFRATVPNSIGLRVGDRVRAIGLSVAVKRADSPDPPALETFTWCVTREVKSEPREARRRPRKSS